jgi:hypothetical protein
MLPLSARLGMPCRGILIVGRYWFMISSCDKPVTETSVLRAKTSCDKPVSDTSDVRAKTQQKSVVGTSARPN